MYAAQVRVHRAATSAREYDAITVCIGDLHLSCDAVNDRAIRLAKRLADAHEAAFVYDDATAARVHAALSVAQQGSANELVSPFYLEGIKEGRAMFKQYGAAIAQSELSNLNSTIAGFSASSPVGQLLRGERDFWKNQVKRASKQGSAA